MLPLDLHVLGLPLAFILSQDQTLHCIWLLNALVLLTIVFPPRGVSARPRGHRLNELSPPSGGTVATLRPRVQPLFKPLSLFCSAPFRRKGMQR